MSKVSKVLMMSGRNGRSANDYGGRREHERMDHRDSQEYSRDWDRQSQRGQNYRDNDYSMRGDIYKHMEGRDDRNDRKNYMDRYPSERIEDEDDYYFKVKGRFGPASMEGHRRKDRPSQKMDEHTAREWTEQMKNEDGTTGPHWSMEQIKKLVEQKKELQEFELADVFAAINMLYSDYVEVAKKFNVNNIDFYICMAKAWLDDDDVATGKGKTAAYYEYVVK